MQSRIKKQGDQLTNPKPKFQVRIGVGDQDRQECNGHEWKNRQLSNSIAVSCGEIRPTCDMSYWRAGTVNQKIIMLTGDGGR